jgi:hypothetical protein
VSVLCRDQRHDPKQVLCVLLVAVRLYRLQVEADATCGSLPSKCLLEIMLAPVKGQTSLLALPTEVWHLVMGMLSPSEIGIELHSCFRHIRELRPEVAASMTEFIEFKTEMYCSGRDAGVSTGIDEGDFANGPRLHFGRARSTRRCFHISTRSVWCVMLIVHARCYLCPFLIIRR